MRIHMPFSHLKQILSHLPNTYFSWKWGLLSQYKGAIYLQVIKWMLQSLKLIISLLTWMVSEPFMQSLGHIKASASNNIQHVSVPNTEGFWKSICINIWFDEESKTHFSFLTTSSVGLWLCHPDLRPQNKSSSDVFLIVTSDRVLWWNGLASSQRSDRLHTATSRQSCSFASPTPQRHLPRLPWSNYQKLLF